MKLSPIASVCLLTLGLAAGCSKGSKPAAASAPVAATPPAVAASTAAPATNDKSVAASAPGQTPFTNEQIFEEFGWFIGDRTGASQFGLTKDEVETAMKGFRAAAEGKPSPYDLTAIGPKMDQTLRGKQVAFAALEKDRNAAAGAAFFAKLQDAKGVVRLPSGLCYEILKPGDGPTPKATDTVRVHYKGTFIDGTVFDSSIDRGQPADFALNAVIPGWTEGLQQINKGGKLKLYVPANLAYGDAGRPGMPPASTLIFELELLDINPPPAAPNPVK